MVVRDELEMPADFQVWTEKANLSGMPRNPRYLDVVDKCYYAWLKSLDPKMQVPARPRLCCDVSQGIERHPWGPEPHTICKGSLVYSFALDRCLDAEDRLLAQLALSIPRHICK